VMMTSLSTSMPRRVDGRVSERAFRSLNVAPPRPYGRSMKIAVYGATGYTAGLVIEELVRRGAEHVPVGRDLSGLRPAFRETAADLRTASLDDPARLAAAFHGCDAVINCVAPFVLHGEPV